MLVSVTPIASLRQVCIPSLIWPGDLADIKFHSVEKSLVDQFLSQSASLFIACKERYQVFSKHLITVAKGQSRVFPISITLLYNAQGQIVHILLMLNSKRGKILGKGLQRTPKTCYDLCTGKTFVKKLMVEKEQEIIDGLLEKPAKGLPPVIGVRALTDKNGVNKRQYFEDLCDGTLSDWIGTEKLSKLEAKLRVIQNIIFGLQALHHIQVSQEVEIKGKDGEKNTRQYVHATCHRDLKPDNILVKSQDAYLSDYGLANTIQSLAGSYAYMCPASLSKKLDENASDEDIIDHTARFGTKFDMWALGLIIVEIMLNKFSDHQNLKSFRIPPLQFIEKNLNPASRLPNRRFILIRQKEVDDELRSLKEIHSLFRKPVNDAIWDLAAQLLKVEPSLSITIDEAAYEIKEIEKTSTPQKAAAEILFLSSEVKGLLAKIKKFTRESRSFEGKVSQTQERILKDSERGLPLAKALFRMDRMIFCLTEVA